jgi:hypothetical protein
MVELREVLEDMERVDVHGNPVPFEIKFVTADERRKTGGDIKHFGKAVMLTNKKRVNASSNLSNIKRQRKKANHWTNATRNIQPVGQNDRIVKVHIHLITHFNGQKVALNIHG